METSQKQIEPVKISFGGYGTHNHPCIWIEENGKPQLTKYILLEDPEDAILTLKSQIEGYLKSGISVEWKLGV